MINLNSYTIENYLYKIGDTAKLGKETMKIEAIVNINENVFFFCSKISGIFILNISKDVSLALSTSPIHALSFHHHNKLSLTNTE